MSEEIGGGSGVAGRRATGNIVKGKFSKSRFQNTVKCKICEQRKNLDDSLDSQTESLFYLLSYTELRTLSLKFLSIPEFPLQ